MNKFAQWIITLLAFLASAMLASCGGGDPVRPGTFSVGAGPQTPPPFFCGQGGVETVATMNDLNYFWQSSVVACTCGYDALANGCTGGAFVYSGPGYGYIFYDANFLNGLYAVTGNYLPSDMVLAHEFGHNIQIALGLPTSGGKYKELQADCLAGFYVGSRVSRGLVTQSAMAQAFSTACSYGDPFVSPWWVPSAHGTCSERVSALQSGISGFLGNKLPGQACPSM